VTWAQLGLHSKPIGLFNVGGHYDALLALVQRAVAEGFVAREPTCSMQTRCLLVIKMAPRSKVTS
jgi:predicted Rossmann-fold nucleotide-binding protein